MMVVPTLWYGSKYLAPKNMLGQSVQSCVATSAKEKRQCKQPESENLLTSTTGTKTYKGRLEEN